MADDIKVGFAECCLTVLRLLWTPISVDISVRAAYVTRGYGHATLRDIQVFVDILLWYRIQTRGMLRVDLSTKIARECAHTYRLQ